MKITNEKLEKRHPTLERDVNQKGISKFLRIRCASLGMIYVPLVRM